MKSFVSLMLSAIGVLFLSHSVGPVATVGVIIMIVSHGIYVSEP